VELISTSLRERSGRAWLEAAGHPGSVTAAVVAVACAATGVFVGLAGEWSSVGEDPLQFAAFAGLALALQLCVVEVHGRGAISFASSGLLAIGFVFGPAPAMGVAFALATVRFATSRGKFYRAVFDAADFALAVAAGALVLGSLDALPGGVVTRLIAAGVAGGIYFLVNTGLLCAAMSLEAGELPGAIWRERFGWTAPYGLAAGPLAYAIVRAYERIGLPGLVAFALPPLAMMIAIRQYVAHTRAHVEELRQKNEELVRLAETARRRHRDTIAALSRSMEAKDYYTGGHVERVSTIAVALGSRLGYAGDDLEAIEIGALLHDIGKIGIPEAILHKPEALDDAEWMVMKRHPVISEFILSGVDLHRIVLQIARSSHERIDGGGYPDGLAGDDIPLPARIVLVADAYDALTSDRPYRPARSHDEAIREIRAHAGSQFCPDVVDALLALADEQPGLLATADRPLLRVA
jgi:hypothetical protein